MFKKKLQSFASAITALKVVPEFHVLLILLPAEKNLPAADDCREIHQPAFQVLDEYLAPLKLGQNFLHVRQGADLIIDGLAARVVPLFHQGAEALFMPFEELAQLREALQPLADLREQRPHLVTRVMFGKTMFHRQKATACKEINTLRGACADRKSVV